jgi:sialidase-1
MGTPSTYSTPVRILHSLLLCGIGVCVSASCASAEPAASRDEVFRKVLRRQGDDQVHTYRIPGLATTPKGTLIAVFDVRHKSSADLPGDIDVGLMRSTDNGETWSKMQVILDFDREEQDSRGNGVGDPTVLVDQKTGQILVVALWSKGNRAWNGSGPGLTPEETGQLVLTRSTDDGLTWSKPWNITQKINGRDPKWRLCFNGPGNGVQLRNGTLVVPAQYRDADGTPRSCFIFSSDSGDTWTISPPAIPTKPPTSESQIAELADGSLLLSMRDELRSGTRAWAKFTWKDDLSTGAWGEPWFTVPDPTCMASLISHPRGLLIFSNPHSAKQRIALTVRSSTDGGQTWSAGRLLDPRPCAYSCLTVLNDGRIGILYECGDKSNIETLTFARFSLDWVQGTEHKP